MKLSDENRALIVKLESDKAKKCLDEVDTLVSLEYWDTAINRLYYGLMHSALALLISDGYSVKTHQGINMAIGEHYVNTGLLAKEHGHFYSKLRNLRERGDYNCSYNADREIVENLVAPAKALSDVLIKLAYRDRN